MPIKPGKSKEVVSSNISELITSKPSKARAKGIKTLAKRRGISEKKAKQKQAIAIAKSKAGKSRGKKTRANNLKPKGTAMERFAISRGAKVGKSRKKK